MSSDKSTLQALEKIAAALLVELKEKGISISKVKDKAKLSVDPRLHPDGEQNKVSSENMEVASEIDRILGSL
jgi:hypothetical protein